MKKECVLYDRDCKECGECSVCDLDRNKKCDNCEKCLQNAEEFRTLKLEEFMIVQEEKEKHNKNRKV